MRLDGGVRHFLDMKLESWVSGEISFPVSYPSSMPSQAGRSVITWKAIPREVGITFLTVEWKPDRLSRSRGSPDTVKIRLFPRRTYFAVCTWHIGCGAIRCLPVLARVVLDSLIDESVVPPRIVATLILVLIR